MSNLERTISSNIKRNQNLSKDILMIYHHTASLKSPILIDTANNADLDIIEEVAETIETPCINVYLPDYNSSNLTDILINLIEKSNGNIELAQKGIVVLNNVDELFIKNSSGVITILNNELPNLIHGNSYKIKYQNQTIDFDTSNVTFIGRGNFSKTIRISHGNYAYDSKYLGGFQEVIISQHINEDYNDNKSKSLVKQQKRDS